MAIYRYTSSSSLPITFQWQCSDCGTINRVSTTIYSNAETSTVGKSPSMKSYMATAASSKMKYMVAGLNGSGCSFHMYRELGLNHACKICNHKEPWAVENWEWLSNIIVKVSLILLIVSGIGMLFSLISLLGGDLTNTQLVKNLIALFAFVVLAVLIVVGYFINKNWYNDYEKEKDRQLNELQISSFPTLVVDNEPIESSWKKY